MTHPSPFAYQKRAILSNPDAVGWFLVAFNPDPNHEYPFILHRDGTILPEIDLIEVTPNDRETFARYLADPELHHVGFVQQKPMVPESIP